MPNQPLMQPTDYPPWHYRGREGSRLPSLRTVRAVFPHTALQSAVSSSGVSLGKPGRVKREQPGPREEGIVPAFVVVKAAAHAGPLLPLPQQRPQPTADKPVQFVEGVAVGVLEVRVPAAQHGVEVMGDLHQAPAPRPARL